MNRGLSRMFWVCCAALVIGMVSCSGGNHDPTPTLYQPPGLAKNWTFVFYDDVEFGDAYNPMEDFCRAMYSGPALHVLVLEDTLGGETNLFFVDEHGNPRLVQELGELNMADAMTLQTVLEIAKSDFPADRYILSLYDHGYGWRGACVDETSHGDILTMNEIQVGLNRTGGVDLVLFSAPCNVGYFENAYELRLDTDVFIGSQETSGFVFWREALGDLRNTLETAPERDTYGLGTQIIDWIWQHREEYEPYTNVAMNLTMSAICTDRLAELGDALNELSQLAMLRMGAFRNELSAVYDQLDCPAQQSPDIFDLADKLLGVTQDEETRRILERIKTSLTDCVLAECHGSEREACHGLSVLCPNPDGYGSHAPYSGYRHEMDFLIHANWDEFLDELLGLSGKTKEYHHQEQVPTWPHDGFVPPGTG